MARQSGSTAANGKGIASRVPVVVSATEPLARKGVLWFDTADVPAVAAGVRNRTEVSGDYTALLTDDWIRVDASGGAVTVTLPAAADRDGKQFDIIKIDSSGNAVTVDADGSELINGALTEIITTQYNTITVASFGTGWNKV